MSQARYPDTGVFVCLEGGEGAGKSTQARLLAAWLTEQGHDVRLTFEPGDTPVGRQLRGIVLDPATGDLSPHTEALLYAADKAEHLHTVVRPALARGEVVITDRYVDSSLAYQGAGGLEAGGPSGGLEGMLRWATDDLRPHLTVLLDLEPRQGLGRFVERDRIEQRDLDYHSRVRQAFVDLAAADPDHYLVLDARRPVEEIATCVREQVAPLLVGVAR